MRLTELRSAILFPFFPSEKITMKNFFARIISDARRNEKKEEKKNRREINGTQAHTPTHVVECEKQRMNENREKKEEQNKKCRQ